MKNDSTQSNQPSTSKADSVPHQQPAGQTGQGQQEISTDSSDRNSMDAQQQGGARQASGQQQQADTGKGSNERQTSPSRDQGHSPSGSSNAAGNDGRRDNSPRQTGKNN